MEVLKHMNQEQEAKMTGNELANYVYEGKDDVIADIQSLIEQFEISYGDLVDVVIAAENNYNDDSMNNLQNQLMLNMGVIDAYQRLEQKHGYNKLVAAFISIVQANQDDDDEDEDPEGSIVASLESYAESLSGMAIHAARGDISIAHVSQDLKSLRDELEKLQTKVDALV